MQIKDLIDWFNTPVSIFKEDTTNYDELVDMLESSDAPTKTLAQGIIDNDYKFNHKKLRDKFAERGYECIERGKFYQPVRDIKYTRKLKESYEIMTFTYCPRSSRIIVYPWRKVDFEAQLTAILSRELTKVIDKEITDSLGKYYIK